MKSNEELSIVRKADMAVADLTSGGLLVAEQMQQFIRVAIKQAIATSLVTVTSMKNPTQEISKMTTMGRVMKPATESEALPVAARSKPGFDKVTLSTTEAIAEVHIPRAALEDQIEGGNFQSSVVQYMGEHVRYDIEDLLVNGDTNSADTWLAITNGLIAQASSNVYPAGEVGLGKEVMRDLYDTLPEQFETQPNLQYWTNRKARQAYRSSLSDRVTDGIGDAIILGSLGKEIGYDDILLRKVPLFPSSLAPNAHCTNVMLLDPKNAILAFHRQMTLDTEWRPSQRIYAIVMTMRLTCKFRHEPMVAKATQVLGA